MLSEEGGRKKNKPFLERSLTIDIYAILTLSIIPQKYDKGQSPATIPSFGQ